MLDCDKSIPAFNKPLCLKVAAATIIVRLLVYEDDDCEFYKWDPVRICQFEPPARKKKRKSPHDSPRHISDEDFPHPPSPWNGIKKVRDWWHIHSNIVLGGKLSSSRKSVTEALERQSWCSTSDEETVLFFLLGLCIDPYPAILSFENFCEERCEGLRKIINSLGPYPTETLIIPHNVDFKDTKIVEAIIRHAPNLEIVHVPYFVTSSDFLKSLRQCKDLVEFSLYGICSSTYFSEEYFYKCFFNGLLSEEVHSHSLGASSLTRSFEKLKVLHFTEYDQTSPLIDAFYQHLPGVSIGCLDLSGKSTFDPIKLESRFCQNNPYLRVYVDKNGLFKYNLMLLAPHLKELLIGVQYNDSKERNDNVVHKLKNIMKASDNLSSFGFAPSDSLSIATYVLPVFQDYGKRITTLDVSYYRTAEIHVGLLYQVLNCCPNLKHLSIGANVPMSKNLITNDNRFTSKSLQFMRKLETFVLHGEPTPFAGDTLPNGLLIGNCIANCAVRLRSLSVALGNKLFNLNKLEPDSMKSVLELHLIISENISYDCLPLLSLAPFPNLTALSVEAESNGVNYFYTSASKWVKQSELYCTGKRPAFVRNIFKYGPGQDFPEPKINLPDMFLVL